MTGSATPAAFGVPNRSSLPPRIAGSPHSILRCYVLDPACGSAGYGLALLSENTGRDGPHPDRPRRQIAASTTTKRPGSDTSFAIPSVNATGESDG